MRTLLLISYLSVNPSFEGPLTNETMVEYAQQELADVAVANKRCKIPVPDVHLSLLLATIQDRLPDQFQAKFAVTEAYQAGVREYDSMSKTEQRAKCVKIRQWYKELRTPDTKMDRDGE